MSLSGLAVVSSESLHHRGSLSLSTHRSLLGGEVLANIHRESRGLGRGAAGTLGLLSLLHLGGRALSLADTLDGSLRRSATTVVSLHNESHELLARGIGVLSLDTGEVGGTELGEVAGAGTRAGARLGHLAHLLRSRTLFGGRARAGFGGLTHLTRLRGRARAGLRHLAHLLCHLGGRARAAARL
jgi:hypothetical protein